MEEKMKEYKSKFTKMMFETLLGLCASWFVYNLAGKLTHSFLFAVIGAAAVLAFMVGLNSLRKVRKNRKGIKKSEKV